VGLGNKGNGGRFNRLWRGRRRQRWQATLLASPRPALPPVGLQFVGGFGLGVSLPIGSALAAGFGLGATVTLIVPEAGGFGLGISLPIGAGVAAGGANYALVPINDTIPTLAQRPRALVPGRAYTQTTAATFRVVVSGTIDLKQLQSAAILLLPPGSGDFVVTGVELRCTAGAGVSSAPVVSLGVVQAGDVVAATTLTGFSAVGDVFALVAQGKTKIMPSGGSLILVVEQAAVGTTLDVVANVIGFFV